EYLHRLGTLDIYLDPFPYNSHTSALDALWMGAPMASIRGRTAVGRGGASILSNIGLRNLIAQRTDEFLKIAQALANDLDGLTRLRATLRERIVSSPLSDASAYTKNVESVYRQVWRQWSVRKP